METQQYNYAQTSRPAPLARAFCMPGGLSVAGGSVRENDADARQFVVDHGIELALDVGPGRGTYQRILGDLIPTMDAVEVWPRYVRRHHLEAKYRAVTIADIREYVGSFDYDLVIFGDVLEHLTRDEALAVWKRASAQARYGLISAPIVHYPQGALAGNPYEVHQQEDLTPDSIRADYGPFVFDQVYDVTGTFIREF